jgi:hypothetical protein
MMPMTPIVATTLRIDSRLAEGLQTVKDRDGIPISEQVRRAIEAWLESKGVKVEAANRPRGKRGRKA